MIKRVPVSEGTVDGPCNGLANDCTHAAANEAVFHGADDHRMRTQHSDGVDDGVVEPGFLARFGQTVLVALKVGKVERIGGAKFEVDEFVSRFQQQVDAAAGVDAKVMATLGADVEVLLKVLLEDSLAATAALDPEAFGADRLTSVIDDLVIFPFEPGHAQSFRTTTAAGLL